MLYYKNKTFLYSLQDVFMIRSDVITTVNISFMELQFTRPLFTSVLDATILFLNHFISLEVAINFKAAEQECFFFDVTFKNPASN